MNCQHNWNNDAICTKCRISYHTHLYYRLKETQIELNKARLEISQLQTKLQESEEHIRKIREKLKSQS